MAAFRFSSDAQRQLAESLEDYDEILLRAGQQSGKTFGAANIAVALLQGRETLDGVDLPLFPSPAVGVLLVRSYKQAQEGAIAAVEKALGDWPHRVVKAQNTIQQFLIKPLRGSDKVSKWSKLVILVSGGEFPAGMRLDFAWADEPPDEDYWRELRSRGKKNRKYVLFITATPIERQHWMWMRQHFMGCGPPGKDGKLELRMNVYDNRALSHAHLRGLERMWANDDLKDAKISGEYIDTLGKCPFDKRGLEVWTRRCTPGTPWAEDPRVECWPDKDPSEPCFVIADPSAGIYDVKGEHDPGEAIVVGRITGQLKKRFNGYVQAHELGAIARKMAEAHNRAVICHERNSGYGESFLLGLGTYGNLYIESHDDRLSSVTDRIGWVTSHSSRGVIVGALQQAILHDLLWVESAAAVESIKGVIVAPNNKIMGADGIHDEDMICLGLAAHLMETMRVYRARKTTEERVIAAVTPPGMVFKTEPPTDPYEPVVW